MRCLELVLKGNKIIIHSEVYQTTEVLASVLDKWYCPAQARSGPAGLKPDAIASRRPGLGAAGEETGCSQRS